MNQPVTDSDFKTAISKVQPSVGKEEIKKYEQWKNEFGSS